MKSNAQPPLYFSMYPLKSKQTEASVNNQTPYLKAILSGNGLTNKRGSIVRLVNADRLAAIRYIRESNWRRGH
jgi:hypothetical protein